MRTLVSVIGGTVLFVLAALYIATDAHAQGCGRPCRREMRSCVAVAKKDFRVARHACDVAGSSLPTCFSDALSARSDAARACRAHRRDFCMPCCTDGGVGGINECSKAFAQTLLPSPQEPGDPVAGRNTLLEGDFMTCGVPFKLWDIPLLKPLIADGFAGDVNDPPIPGRTGNNDGLPYFLTAFTTPGGVDVVQANCLLCHGGEFDGELIIGLGNPTRDFTSGAGGGGGSFPTDDAALDALGLNAAEKDEVRKLFARGAIVGPQTIVRTVGMNPAEMLAVVLMQHHDRDTLAWSDTPLFAIDVRDENGVPIDDPKVTSDPPPWWRVHKKNALFYNGMARGDHRGTMSAATSVCVDSVMRAQEVDEMFKDINAFIESIRPPAYPRAIDAALAAEGKAIFTRDCQACHGTYDANEALETYPNLLLPLDVIGTDPVVANAGVIHTPELVDWYNASFYGQITPLEPDDPFPGYMPPPLDGIWATAPYLHNGSVPNLELLLNSGERPAFWKRVDYDSTNFDEEAVGWPYVEVETPQAEAPASEAKFIYDTTYWSQSNKGHRFGDHLSRQERRALIEYLKTL
jgi:mono/diheme cytochrome c family protein